MSSLKTDMPDPKPARIILYHNDCIQGKTFDLDQAEGDYENMIEDGWVDTPADLEPLKEEVIEVALDPTMNTEQLIAAVKSLGFHVLTDVELAVLTAQPNQPDAPLIDVFFKSPTDLNKEELIVLGADYDLSLKMTMKEETMIGHISQAIEDSKT